MNVSRRDFLGLFGMAVAVATVPALAAPPVAEVVETAEPLECVLEYGNHFRMAFDTITAERQIHSATFLDGQQVHVPGALTLRLKGKFLGDLPEIGPASIEAQSAGLAIAANGFITEYSMGDETNGRYDLSISFVVDGAPTMRLIGDGR